MSDCDVAQIRVATLEDVPGLARMHVASWHETYSGILPDTMLSSLTVDGRAAAWAQIMRQPSTPGSTVIYLAEHEGIIIGFGSCGAQRTASLKDKGYDGEVSAIYVLRDFQKRKIGARLLAVMSLDLSRRAFSAAALWVLRDNLGARRFYERYAGQVIGEREDVRDGAALSEVAYGWPDLKQLDRLLSRADAIEPLRARLSADLLVAMKSRDQAATNTLRSLLGVLDNAGAQDLEAFAGSIEVPRRSLTQSELDALMKAEVTSRRTAIIEYERGGRHRDAERLRAELVLLGRYLTLTRS